MLSSSLFFFFFFFFFFFVLLCVVISLQIQLNPEERDMRTLNCENPK
jgi:protein-S-isoprenylcysteine O-methyltransferase Ste14